MKISISLFVEYNKLKPSHTAPPLPSFLSLLIKYTFLLFLKLSLTNIQNELIRDGYISFDISEKFVRFNKAKFYLGDIGVIESEINYEEEMGEIIFNSSNSIKIQNYKNFAKKFQLNKRKVENLNNIYFKIKKNINTGLISISDIEINKLDNLEKNKEKLVYNVKNTQELKTLVKKIINN